MSDSALDSLRKDAIVRRLKALPGGNHIFWSAKDFAAIRDYVMAAPERIVRAAPAPLQKSDADYAAIRRKFAKAGIVRAAQSDDLNFLFTISSNRVDLAGDTIDPAGIDFSDFSKNPAVLNAHDSSALPIATSTPPWVSGAKLMAIAKFPQPGINADADAVAAAVRASLVRGASIGFMPIKWNFTSDPARPFGINFQTVKLFEWSCCSLPCNQDCLLIGAVASGQSASEARTLAARVEAIGAGEAKNESLRADIRALAARIAKIPDPTPQTREQRIAEARNFRKLLK